MKKISSLVRKILSEVGRNEMLAWGYRIEKGEREHYLRVQWGYVIESVIPTFFASYKSRILYSLFFSIEEGCVRQNSYRPS